MALVSKRWLMLIGTVFTVAAAGCGEVMPSITPSMEPTTEIPLLTNNDGEELERLDMTLIPHVSSKAQSQSVEVLGDYLEEKLGVPVGISLAKDYDEAVNLLTSEQVAIAYLGAASYIKAKEQNPDLRPILAPINRDTGRPWYTSVIVARAELPNLQALQGKRFGFVSESSTSGFLVASYNLKKQGMDPQTYFAEINYAGSHNKNVDSLIAGKVDAIAIDQQTYLRNKETGILNAELYKMIWESDPIPNPPIVVSTKLLSYETILALKKTLIAAPEGLVSVTGADSTGYTIVEDQDYSTIREIYLNLE